MYLSTEIYDILLNSKVEGYFRYVDDIVYKENHTNINDILNRFNNRMKLILQQEQDKRINSLNVAIIKDENKLSFDIYRKPNDIYRKPKTTDTIIPNDSFHPMGYKLPAIRYFSNRLETYNLDPRSKQRVTNTLKQIIYNNK
jgi:hypothetical protein